MLEAVIVCVGAIVVAGAMYWYSKKLG